MQSAEFSKPFTEGTDEPHTLAWNTIHTTVNNQSWQRINVIFMDEYTCYGTVCTLNVCSNCVC